MLIQMYNYDNAISGNEPSPGMFTYDSCAQHYRQTL